MQQTAFDLCGAGCGIGAEPACLVFFFLQRSTAIRTNGREVRHLCIRRAALQRHTNYLGNDFSTFYYLNRISDADIQLVDIILVMEGGVGDGGPRQPDGLDHRLGGQNARASHLHHDIHNL